MREKCLGCCYRASPEAKVLKDLWGLVGLCSATFQPAIPTARDQRRSCRITCLEWGRNRSTPSGLISLFRPRAKLQFSTPRSRSFRPAVGMWLCRDSGLAHSIKDGYVQATLALVRFEEQRPCCLQKKNDVVIVVFARDSATEIVSRGNAGTAGGGSDMPLRTITNKPSVAQK
ncbi:uncharacterized protein K460DRAFT_14893 [Cucurbitaria berberidis CBS 394.84]|uniref:Uncharacterized protein n=1 Tax=Cucurbitaria berberidis CBS 394.84 TaxID=1168544 RepID=A0A9P4LDR8_9PLEO|nr:uncharacterized protein K460DRAFT_14893 [Cucurbitaria berberidis CBS 394.84]KAF1850384.1 hypothetical protein K460DRAFT_14893 [Cucurbitaria berberidis CBS 394.84]